MEPRIHIIGAGGVGFWVAVALAQAGVEFTIYDTDDLSGGLGHTRLPRASLSTKKVSLLRGHCIAVWGSKPPTVVDALFTGAECVAGDYVIDCCDMELEARRVIYDSVKASGARYLRISYDGKNNTVSVGEGLPLRGRKGGGYSEVPGLALSFMAGGIGALAVQSLLKGEHSYIEFQVSLSEQLASATLAVAPPVVEKPVRRPRKSHAEELGQVVVKAERERDGHAKRSLN
jgi:hypothetical protein